jgi:prolyl-tRNA synthetase
MFADAELIGIPHRITIGKKSLQNNVIEYKSRTESDAIEIAVDEALEKVIKLVKVN